MPTPTSTPSEYTHTVATRLSAAQAVELEARLSMRRLAARQQECSLTEGGATVTALLREALVYYLAHLSHTGQFRQAQTTE